MAEAMAVYAEAVGHSHEAAVAAVYAAGYADGIASTQQQVPVTPVYVAPEATPPLAPVGA